MDKAITNSEFELSLLSIISSSTDYSKNDTWYRIRILKFANLLHNHYGGDIDLICVIILLDNCGARFPEFTNKVNEKGELIQEILQQIEFPENKISLVANHFKSLIENDYLPFTLEDKIINDAVLLAGFGASGIVRYAMWNEFSGLDLSSFSEIENIFHEKLKRLVFPESILLAEKENKFLYLFSAIMEKKPILEKKHRGKYIILEGNSGVGKNTQAENLKQYFESIDKKAVIIEEPTKIYRKYEKFWLESNKRDIIDDIPIFRLFSIIGDRGQQIYGNVGKELETGNIVISVRSFLSMLVYQCENELDRKKINYIHQFVPRPDIVILYDADEKICLERALARGSRLTYFDKLKSLEKYRPIYLEVAKSQYFDFPIEIVDATGSPEDVTKRTINILNNYI
jgi:dTMP kinase